MYALVSGMSGTPPRRATRPGAALWGGERQLLALEVLAQKRQVARAAVDVVPGVERVRDAELRRGGRHQLHQPERPGRRHRVGAKAALDRDDREQQALRQLVLL